VCTRVGNQRSRGVVIARLRSPVWSLLHQRRDLHQSNRPSFASIPRDIHDDATCTTCRRSFASFEAKLGNPSPTCFSMMEVTRCQCVSSHRLHPLISFEVQTDKPPPTWFWGLNRDIIMVILRPKSLNCHHQF
jgi:hypothetical protein